MSKAANSLARLLRALRQVEPGWAGVDLSEDSDRGATCQMHVTLDATGRTKIESGPGPLWIGPISTKSRTIFFPDTGQSRPCGEVSLEDAEEIRIVLDPVPPPPGAFVEHPRRNGKTRLAAAIREEWEKQPGAPPAVPVTRVTIPPPPAWMRCAYEDGQECTLKRIAELFCVSPEAGRRSTFREQLARGEYAAAVFAGCILSKGRYRDDTRRCRSCLQFHNIRRFPRGYEGGICTECRQFRERSRARAVARRARETYDRHMSAHLIGYWI